MCFEIFDLVLDLPEFVPASEVCRALGQRFNKGEPGGFETDFYCPFKFFDMVRCPACHKVCSCRNREFREIEGRLGASVRGRCRQAAPGGGRASLPTGHAIDLVVHADYGKINVPAAGVDKMVATYGSEISVTGKDNDVESGVCHFYSGRKS